MVTLEDFLLAQTHHFLLSLTVLKQLNISSEGILEKFGLTLEKDGFLVRHSNLAFQFKFFVLHTVGLLLGSCSLVLNLAALVVQPGLVS